MTRPGTLLDLRSDVYDRLMAVVIDAWVEARPYTGRALAEAMAEAFGVDADKTAEDMTYYLRALEKRGIYTPQAAPIGSKGVGNAGAPTSPYAFNWTKPRIEIKDASLATVVAAYVASDGVDAVKKSALRTALRFYFGLPTKCTDDVILVRCAQVPTEQLYELPGRLLDEATAPPAPISSQTALNYRTAVRAAMRWAAGANVTPVVFPWFVEVDAWREVLDRYFPLATTGATPRKVAQCRQGWRYFARACRAVHGDDVTPDAVTREMATIALNHIQRKDGCHAAARFARKALRVLARDHQYGPWAEPHAADEFYVDTPRGRQPAIFLRGTNGVADGGTWEGLVGLVRQRGFPEETVEFLEWYGTYVTMTPEELMRRRKEFPRRRDAHRLKAVSLKARTVALRAHLGAAVNELAIPPAELTPERLFGADYGDIAHALVDWWGRRRDALHPDDFGSSVAGAIKHYVIGSGMVAYALYERLRHERRLRPAERRTAKTVRLDTRSEEAAVKTAAETAAWEAYRESSCIADTLIGMAKEIRGVSAKGSVPEFKDIKRIVEHTPPAWWIRLLNSMLDRWRAEKRAGRDHSVGYHELVLNVFELGAYISTGCRNEELCLARLDVQAKDLRRTRTIALRANDRKNEKSHTVMLQPVYVPDDLLEEYLISTRPFFMRDTHLIERRQRGGERAARSHRVQDHAFLLVNTQGVPYGCVEETLDGKGRDGAAFAVRAASHGRRLQWALALEAVRAGLTLPTHKYEFGLHCIRGACAFGIFVHQGEQAAAHYLGDAPQTVLSAYAAIDGTLVDSSALVAVDLGPKLALRKSAPATTKQEPRPSTVTADYAEELDKIVARFERGLIDEAEFQAARAAIRIRFALTTPAPQLLAG